MDGKCGGNCQMVGASRKFSLWPVIGAVVCCVLGIASGLGTAGGMDGWYQSLQKPAGNPPPWVFGPVWTILYLLMGIAAGQLLARGAWVPFGYFLVNFLLNLAWTPAFFGAHWLVGSLAIIVGMGVFLVLAILSARKVDAVSAGLWVPYLLWIIYATYLNGMIAWLNR